MTAVSGLVVTALAVALAWAPWPWLLAALVLVLAVACLVWPALGLALTALAVPFGSRAPLPLAAFAGDAVGGASLTAAPLLLAWTALGVALHVLRRRARCSGGDLTSSGYALPTSIAHPAARFRSPLRLARAFVAVACAAYLLALGASALGAASLVAAVLDAARWVVFALACLLAAVVGRSGRGRVVVLAGLLVAVGVEAIVGWTASVGAVGPEAFGILGGRLTRAYGSFGQPNPFGGYMNMAWPIGAALLAAWWVPVRARTGRVGDRQGMVPVARKLHVSVLGVNGGAVAALCGGALILSWSRGAWLAALAGAGAMALVRLARAVKDREPRTLVAGYLAVVAAVALAAFGLLPRPPASIAARLASIASGPALAAEVAQAEVTDANFATVERLAHWAAAGSMFAERPWLGQGPGHYELAYAAHRLPRWPVALGHAHNYPLNALAETGMIGAAAWLLLVVSILWACLRAALTERSPARAALALGALGVWSATATHSLFDHLFVHDLTAHLGLLTGLVLARTAPEAQQEPAP